MRRVLDALATALALIGGVTLLAIAVMTALSVAGRWFGGRPLTGDIELVQLGVAVSIALFLPYCQWRGGHLFVDFFTARSSGPTQRRLDALGSVVTGALFLLLAWRAGVGVGDMRRAGETSMVLGVALWIPYAAMVPGLALAGVAGFARAVGGRVPGSATSGP
jgi:TRAP-type C4-dicarboxylate transport system permease small subunit